MHPGAPLGTTGQGSSAGHESIDQGVIPVARGRMHHQTGRLVDDREMLVLEDHLEVHRRRLEGAGWFRFGKSDAHQVPALQGP